MFYLLCEWQKLYEAYYKLISGLHKFCKRFCYYARAKIYAHPLYFFVAKKFDYMELY